MSVGIGFFSRAEGRATEATKLTNLYIEPINTRLYDWVVTAGSVVWLQGGI
jgi:hypothetical protein